MLQRAYSVCQSEDRFRCISRRHLMSSRENSKRQTSEIIECSHRVCSRIRFQGGSWGQEQALNDIICKAGDRGGCTLRQQKVIRRKPMPTPRASRGPTAPPPWHIRYQYPLWVTFFLLTSKFPPILLSIRWPTCNPAAGVPMRSNFYPYLIVLPDVRKEK